MLLLSIALEKPAAAVVAQKHPWAILVCKFSDDTIDPATVKVKDLQLITDPGPKDEQTLLSLMTEFFTSAGNSTFNLPRYFTEMSHGNVDIGDSKVFIVNVNLTVAQGSPSAPPADGNAYAVMVTEAAKAAAVAQGVRLQDYYGVIITSAHLLAMSQGAPSYDGTPWVGLDYRWVRNNGVQAFGHEVGHGFGLDHSRQDGFPDDYLDPVDIMSTRHFPDSGSDPDYGAHGPGLNAWNMRSRGWLDETRVLHATGQMNTQVQLRPLHRTDLSGFLAAELPPMNNTDGKPEFLIEYRKKENWDSGISHSSVSIRRFEGPLNQALGTHSYIMAATNGDLEMVAGDIFAPGGQDGPQVQILGIDDASSTATIAITAGFFTDLAPGAAAAGNTTFGFGTDRGGHLRANHAAYGGNYSGWLELDGAGGSPDSVEATWLSPVNVLFAFCRGYDNAVYQNQSQPGGAWTGWSAVPGQTTDAPPAVTSSSVQNSVLTVVKGTDQKLYQSKAVYGGAWSAWTAVPGNFSTISGPAIATFPQRDVSLLFARRSDNTIWSNQGVTGSWLPYWNQLPGALTDAAPAATADNNTMYVFIKEAGTARILMNKAVYGQSWSGWTPVVTGTTSAPAAAILSNGIIFLYFRQTDGTIAVLQGTGTGSFYGWQVVPGGSL